jgi:Xaa-Pro aminopeptidase
MITMTNVLKHGLTTWDRATLPEDEFEERVRALRAAMAAEGLEAVVSLGHATRPGPFAYFSGFVPPLGWMGVVIGREADPILVSGGGSRERIFVRTVTPIEDLRNSRSLFHGPAEIVSEALAEVAEAGDRIGLVGADDALTDATRRELAEALSVYAVSDANQLLTTIRTVKRPREVTALRRSLAIARRAVDDAIKRFEEGESAAAALLAAEATGRRSGGRDVRVLGDLGDGQLAPVAGGLITAGQPRLRARARSPMRRPGRRPRA